MQRVRGELAFDHVMLPRRQWHRPGRHQFRCQAGYGDGHCRPFRQRQDQLIRLVPRFYEPSGGVITLDGVALDDYPLADLRRQVAIVGQKVMLFDDTIAANIAYGMEATDEQIRAAAKPPTRGSSSHVCRSSCRRR